MADQNSKILHYGLSTILFKVIFYFCAFYFLLMGAILIVFPEFLVKGLTNSEVNPTVIAMLRGAGGATIPYAVLYSMIAKQPFKRFWGVYTILAANFIAIALDLLSVFLHEYKWSYAMYDIPVELLSIVGMVILWYNLKYIQMDN